MISRYRYYEETASEIMGITPTQMFTKTRKSEVVTARYFCIYFRNKVLNFSMNVSAKRYGRDHAVTYHAVKVIEDTYMLDKIIKKKFENFMSISSKKKDLMEIEASGNGNDDFEFKTKLKPSLIKSMKNMVYLQNAIYSYLDDFEDESAVMEYLSLCKLSLAELEKWFDYDYTPVVGSGKG